MVLALAVISAIAAVVLARGLVGNQPRVDPEVVEKNVVPMVDVLVAAADVPLGDKIEATKLRWQPWPRDAVRGTMVTKESKPEARTEFENSRARTQLFEGEPVNEQKLVLQNSSGFMAAVLPKGMRAISVAISAETGAGGFILPNDRVDVLLTYKDENSGQSRNVSETVMTNVRVLAIDQTFKTNDKGEQVVVGRTATLELEPNQTEVLAFAEQSGQLSLTLRSIADNGDSALGDTGPRLSERYAKGQSRNEVSVNRHGVVKKTTLNN
jgi:pilus assembly protein CpaB